MLKRLTAGEFDLWVNWAYELAMSEEYASYPTYRDGIKTREDFIQRSRRGLEDEEILLFRHEGEVQGWIHWYTIPGDCYAQTVAFLVADHADEAVGEFTAYAAKRIYRGEVYIGLPEENRRVISALEKHGFELAESSVNHTMHFDRYQLGAFPGNVSLMRPEDEADFRRLHDDADMYWTAERILNRQERWRCYLCRREARAVGVLCAMQDGDCPEVFAIEFEDDVFSAETYRSLMEACLWNAKAAGCNHMTYFEEDEQALPVLAALGFSRVGRYICYRRELKEE